MSQDRHVGGGAWLVLSRSLKRRRFIILYKPCTVRSNRNQIAPPTLARSRCPSLDSTSPTTRLRHPYPSTSSPGTQPWHTLSMANYSNQNFSSSSSNYYQATKEVAARSNIQASAYTVDAVDMALKGFHYSTCGAGGT